MFCSSPKHFFAVDFPAVLSIFIQFVLKVQREMKCIIFVLVSVIYLASLAKGNFISIMNLLKDFIKLFSLAIEWPIEECSENEEFLQCGPNCPPVCGQLKEPCYVNFIVCPHGCFCLNGFARNAMGKCVKIEDCDKKDSKKKCKTVDDKTLSS
jgi:hypothetical protein